MDWNELEPRTKKPQPKDLGPLGIEELKAYISELQSEITRAEAAIAARESHRSGVEALFKK